MLFQNIVYQLDFFQRNVGYANHLNFLGCSFSFFRFAVLGMRNKTVILSRTLMSPGNSNLSIEWVNRTKRKGTKRCGLVKSGFLPVISCLTLWKQI